MLLKGDFALDGYVMGRNAPAYVEEVDWGSTEIEDQDSQSPSGVTYFGEDRLYGPTIQLAIATNVRTVEGAQAALQDVTATWRASRKLGELSVLQYRGSGETRRVFGRPRNIGPVPEKYFMHQGYIVAVAEFKTQDANYYLDAQKGKTVTMVPAEPGGWVAPFVFPLRSFNNGQRRGIITVEGNTETPFKCVIHGPISDPWVSVNNWRFNISTNLAYDQWLTIDTSGPTSIMHSHGGSLAGRLGRRSSRLSEAKLKPGPTEILFGGTDPTGTATCKLSYRPAFTSF